MARGARDDAGRASGKRPRLHAALRAPLADRARPTRELPVRADEMAGIAVGVPLKVILVLGFGFPEVAGRNDLGYRLARPEPRRIDVCDRVFGDLLLILTRV